MLHQNSLLVQRSEIPEFCIGDLSSLTILTDPAHKPEEQMPEAHPWTESFDGIVVSVEFPDTLEGMVHSEIFLEGCRQTVRGEITPHHTSQNEEGNQTVFLGVDTPKAEVLYSRGVDAIKDKVGHHDNPDIIARRVLNMATVALAEQAGSVESFSTDSMLYYSYIDGLKALGVEFVEFSRGFSACILTVEKHNVDDVINGRHELAEVIPFPERQATRNDVYDQQYLHPVAGS